MADTDPAEIHDILWSGVRGTYGLDIGARNGESIADFIRCGFTKITCFEPSPQAYPNLARVANNQPAPQSNEQIIESYNLAVSDHSGTVDLYSVPRAMAKGELVSMIDGMEWSLSDWVTAKKVTVGCISLDTFCATRQTPPDFVKVDTEGHEVKVLIGAQSLLRRVPGWLIEFHSPQNYEDCLRILVHAGYSVETVRHPHYRRGSPMWYQHGWIRAAK